MLANSPGVQLLNISGNLIADFDCLVDSLQSLTNLVGLVVKNNLFNPNFEYQKYLLDEFVALKVIDYKFIEL